MKAAPGTGHHKNVINDGTRNYARSEWIHEWTFCLEVMLLPYCPMNHALHGLQ